MQQIILDTSFIISAIKQKVDFFDSQELKGMKFLVPTQAIRELEGLGAGLALQILEKNEFELLNIPGKNADNAIIAFAKKNPSVIVATLDAGLKKKIRNRKLVIRQKKKVEIM